MIAKAAIDAASSTIAAGTQSHCRCPRTASESATAARSVIAAAASMAAAQIVTALARPMRLRRGRDGAGSGDAPAGRAGARGRGAAPGLAALVLCTGVVTRLSGWTAARRALAPAGRRRQAHVPGGLPLGQ
jgi:hypothetical protein